MDQYARHLEMLIQTYVHHANQAASMGDQDRAKYLKATMEGVCCAQEAYLEIQRAEVIAAQASNSQPMHVIGPMCQVHFDPRGGGRSDEQ